MAGHSADLMVPRSMGILGIPSVFLILVFTADTSKLKKFTEHGESTPWRADAEEVDSAPESLWVCGSRLRSKGESFC